MKIKNDDAVSIPQKPEQFRLAFYDEEDLQKVASLAAQEVKAAVALLTQKTNLMRQSVTQANASAYDLCQSLLIHPLSTCQQIEALSGGAEDIETSLPEFVDDFKAEKESLETRVYELRQAKIGLKAFQLSKQLGYACRFPGKIKAIAFKTGLITVEALINAPIMAALSENGGSESLLYAASVSLGNILLASATGWAFCQCLDRQRKFFRYFQVLSIFLAVAQLGFACLVAGMVSLGEDGNFDPAQSVATLVHSARLFPWQYSMSGFRLWAITLGFGCLSTIMVYRGFLFETFPGYADAAKPYHTLQKQIQSAFQSLQKKIKTQRPSLPQGPLPEAEAMRDVRLLGAAITKMKAAIQDYTATEEHNRRVYETACGALLGHFEIFSVKQKITLQVQSLSLRATELQEMLRPYETLLHTKQAEAKATQERRRKQISDRLKQWKDTQEGFIQRLSESLAAIERDEPSREGSTPSNIVTTDKWGG